MPNRFTEDRALRHGLERLLTPENFASAASMLGAFAERTPEYQALVEVAERNTPKHVPFDAWGRRIDRIDVDPAWTTLVRIGQEAGVVALAYEDDYAEQARLVQFGLLALFNPVSATADCPLSMTDAAARVLLTEDPVLAERYVPRLTARTDAWTSGQWMTETTGGSDVGRTETTARKDADGNWTLHGTKWFTSATTADMSLALARPEGAPDGSKGLSLFLLELRNADGSWNGLQVRRLKDKLGTKALPTAEMDLNGTVAVPVGEMGRGVRTIATMLNITRVHAAFGSLGEIGGALSLARDYARRREAFGRKLVDLPLHRAWIARVAAEYEAALSLGLRAAELLGSVERTGADAELARVVFPLTKMSVARQGVWCTSELIESFGGAGYVEDTGLPRFLRDAHVQCIWEGTTSVLALDVVRALRAPGVAEAFLEDVEAKARAADHPLLADATRAVLAAKAQLIPMLADVQEGTARRLAWGMARTYQGALLCQAAGWALDKKGDARAATAARLICSEALIGPDLPPDGELGALAFGVDA